jgi:small subunit ribosomal protein S2
VLFVDTRRSGAITYQGRLKSAQFYMNHRWLGGTLTSAAKTVSKSIQRLRNIDENSRARL